MVPFECDMQTLILHYEQFKKFPQAGVEVCFRLLTIKLRTSRTCGLFHPV